MESFDEKELLAIANGVDTSSNVEAELDENELLAIANGEDVSKSVSQSVAKDNSLPAKQVLGEYDTKLNPNEETQYQKWRQTLPKNLQYEGDYDLRGYWKDPETTKEAVEGDHFIDKYKKPNHPTFSNESQYAVGENAKKAGKWEGEKYIPASQKRGITMSADEMNVPQSTILSKDEAKEKGEMNANEVAARSYEQATGVDAPDNGFLAHIANMGNNIGGRLNANLQMQAAQQLLAKSDNRSDDETRGLFSKMIFGATKYLGAGLFVDDALDEWDETEGKTYKTPEERTRARNAFVDELARQFIAERTATQHNATMELENRDQGFWATVLGKGPEQVGNTLPYMLGPVGIALQFAQQSTATGVDYANDVYGFAKDGSLGVIAEGDSAGKAALKGTASGAFETASEIVGGKIAGAALKRFGKVLYKGGKVLVGKFPVISEKAGKFAETQVGHAVSKFGMGLRNLFAWTSKRLHLENPIEENIEEWETDNLNALFGTGARDSEYVNADTGAPLEAWDRIKKANSEFFDPNNLIKLNEAMLLTMGGGSFVSYMAQRGMKKQVDSFLREHKLMSEEEIASTDLQNKAQALDAWAKGLSEEEVLNKINSATSWTDKLAAKIAGEPSQAENTVTLKRHLSEMDNFNSLIERAGEIDKTVREQGGTTKRFTIQQDENGKPKFDTTIIADPVTDDNIERKEMFDADSGVTIIDANGTYVVKSLVTGEKFKTTNFNRAINAADAMAVLNQQRANERQTKAQVIDNLLHSEAYNSRNIKVFETAEQARQSIGGDFENDAPGFITEDGTTVLILDNIDDPVTALAMLDKGTENDRGAFADGVNFETVSEKDSDGEVIETRIARDKVHDVAIIENPDGNGFTVFGKDVPYTNVATLEEATALARGEKIETPKEEVITNETRTNEAQPKPEQTQSVVPPAGETARSVEAGEASPEVGAKVASNTFRGHEVPNSATDAQKHTLEAVFGDGKIVNISVDDKGQMRVKTAQTVNGREFYRDDIIDKDGNIIDDTRSTDETASNEKGGGEVAPVSVDNLPSYLKILSAELAKKSGDPTNLGRRIKSATKEEILAAQQEIVDALNDPNPQNFERFFDRLNSYTVSVEELLKFRNEWERLHPDTKIKYGKVKIERYITIEEAVEAGKAQGYDVSKNPAFNVDREGWRLPNGTVVIVYNNIPSPWAQNKLIRREIVRHNEKLNDVVFFDSATREAQTKVGREATAPKTAAKASTSTPTKTEVDTPPTTTESAEGGSDAAESEDVANKKTAQVAEKPTENADLAAQRAEKSARLESNLEQPETEAAVPLEAAEAKSIKKRLEKKRKRGLALTDQETALLGRAEEAIKADEKAKRDATRAITEEKAKVVEVPQFLLNKSKKVSKERINEIEDYLKDSKHNGPSLSVAISEVEKWKKYNHKGLLYFPQFVSKIDNEIENAKKRRDKLNAATKLGNLETKMLIPQTKLNEYLKKTYSPLLEFWDSNKRKLIERPMSRMAGKRNSQMGVYGKEKAYGKGNSFGFAGRDVAVEGLNLFFDGMPASGIDGLSRDTLLRLIFGENTQEVTDEYATHNDEVLVEITKLVNGDLGGYMTAGENRSSSSENTHYNIDYTQDVNALITDFLKELSQFREYLKTNETTEERQMREYYEYEEEQRIKRNAELEKEREEEIGPIVEEYALDELSAREAADEEYAKALAYVENNATAKDIAILKPSNLLAAEEGDEIRMDHHKTKFGFVHYDAENGILYLSGFDEVETDEGTRLIPNERRFRVTEDSITEIAEEKNDTRREKGASDNRASDEKGASRGGSREEGQGGSQTEVEGRVREETERGNSREVSAGRTGESGARTDNRPAGTAGNVNQQSSQYKTIAKAVDLAWQADNPNEVAELLKEGIDASAVASNPNVKGTDEVSWPVTATRVGNREDAANIFRIVSNPDVEITKVLYLDEDGNILDRRITNVGIIGETDINVENLISNIPEGTYGIILSHNHPAQQGDDVHPTIGYDDVATNWLKNLVESVGVKLLDHIITDHNAYYSFGGTSLVSEGANEFWSKAQALSDFFGESVEKPSDVMNLVSYDERIDLTKDVIGRLNALAALASKTHDKSSWVVAVDDNGKVAWIAAAPKNANTAALRNFIEQHHGGRRYAVLNGENAVDMPSFVKALKGNEHVFAIGENGKLVDFGKDGSSLNDKILNAAKPTPTATPTPRLANAPKLDDETTKEINDILGDIGGLLDVDNNRHDGEMLFSPVASLTDEEEDKFFSGVRRMAKALKAKGYNTFEDMIRTVASMRPDIYERGKDLFRRAWNFYDVETDGITIAHGKQIFGKIDNELKETTNDNRRSEPQAVSDGGTQSNRGGQTGRGTGSALAPSVGDSRMGSRDSDNGTVAGREPSNEYERGGDGSDGSQFGEELLGGGYEGDGGESDRLRTDEQRSDVRADAEQSVSTGSVQSVESTEEVTPGFTEYQPPADLPVAAPKSQSLIVESSALASVTPPKIETKPKIPDSIPSNGVLQAHQYQAVCQAVNAHNKLLPDGRRMGYFCGDGTGVGKTRTIAGVLLDAMNRKLGKSKALIVSKNSDLFDSAKSDFEPFGLADNLFKLDDKGRKRLGFGTGIAFTTYDGLAENYAGTDAEGNIRSAGKKGKTTSRYAELVRWLGKDFDGVIAFDEAHSAAKDDGSGASPKGQVKRAQAVIDLQAALPNARILYLTATSAYNAEDLRFLQRMGLWGEGAGFRNLAEFSGAINKGGLSMMEMLTQGMKARGQYCSRSISFKGVTCRREVAVMTPEQKEIYDNYRSVITAIYGKLAALSIYTGDNPAQLIKMYFGRALDLFNSVITAMKVKKAIEIGRQAIADGKSPVFQLISTNEAAKNVKNGGKKKRAEINLFSTPQEVAEQEEQEVGVKDRVISYLKGNGFPIREWLEEKDAQGKHLRGDIIPEAAELRDDMIALAETLPDVGNPIDEIVKAFQDVGISRISSGSNKNAEADAFNSGKNLALVFSGAGGTGASYHADKRFKNQRQRVQIPIEFGWEPDKFIQALGRSHRNNQVVPPEFVLLTTDIAGEMRFMSTIANRVASMGAIVGGDRNSSGQVVSAADSMDNTYGRAAIKKVARNLASGQVIGDVSGIEALHSMFLNPDKIDKLDANKFLGRLQFLSVDDQNEIYSAISSATEKAIAEAKADGSYDDGIRKIEANRTIVKSRQTLSKGDSNTETRELLTTSEWYDSRRITHEELEKRSPQGRTVEYVRNKRSGKLYGIIQNGDRIARLAPDGSYTTLQPLERGNYETIINKDAARKEWDDEYSKLPAEVEKINHYMAGDLIPVWDKIGIQGRPFVYRGAPVGSKPFIGVHITDTHLPVTLYGFGKKEEARKFFNDNAYRLASREGMKIGLTAAGREDDQPYFKRAKIGTRYVLTAFKVSDASSMAGDFIDSGWDSTWAKDEDNAFDKGGTVYYREFGEDAEAAFNEIINKYGVVIYHGDKVVFESRDDLAPMPIERTPVRRETDFSRSTIASSRNNGSLGARLGMPNMRMRVERGELIITNTDARFKNDLKLAFGGEWANRVYDGKRYVKSDLRWHKSPVGRGGWWSIPLNKVPANILVEVENDGMLHSSVAPLSSVEEMNRDGGIARLSQNPDEFKATFVYNLLRSEVMPLGDSSNTVISEKELIRRAIDDGDMAAIGELYNRYMAANAAKGGLKGLIRRAAARKGMERVMNESRIEEIASLVWAGTSVDGGYELNRSGIIADINAGNIDIYKKTGSLIPIMSEKIERILNDIAERAKYRPEMPTLDAPSRSRENESELDQQIADDSSVAEGLYGADASNEYVESADYLNTTIAEKLRDVGEVIGRPLTSSERNRLNAMDMLDELMYFLPEEYQDILNSVLKAERERGLTVNNTYKDPNGLKVLASSYEKAQIASGLSKRVFNARLIEARKLMNEIWENIKNGKSDDNIAIKTGELVGAEETDEELNESILEGMSENASTSDMALAIRLLLRGESVEDVAYFFDISPAMVRAWKARARNEHLIVFPGDEAENTLGLDNFPERKAVKRGSRSGTTRKARSTAWTPDLFPSANATVNDITEEKIAEGIAAGATDEEIARDANTSPEIVKLHRIRGKSVEKTKKNTALVDYFADIRNKPKEGLLFASVAPLEQETLGIELPATVEAMGFTNAEMNKWRSEHGFTELAKRAKMSLDDLHRQGAAMANNTDEMRKMIERHERAPYAINAVDQIALGQFIVNLQNKYYELSNKKREAHDNGNEPLAIQYDTEMDEVFSWVDRAHRVNKTVGAEWGRTGRARQIAIDKAGNLADYMVSCVKAKGVSLTKSERAEAELIYRKFEEAREKHENLKLEDIISQLDALSKIRLARQQDGIKERKGKYTPENIERDYVEALAQIRYHGEHRSGGVLHGLPNGQKWIRAIEAYHLMNGEGLTNGNPDGAKMAQLVLNDILAQGVEATLWDVRQIESRMGNLIKPSQDEISKSLRDIHTQLLVEQQIEHILTTGEMPPKTGFDRDIQSAAARQLRRERDRIIREKGIDRRTYEERLKTALDSYKTRLRNQIEENEKAIADIEAGRPYTPRTNHKLTLDEEAQALKERNKELRDRIKELTDDPAKNLEKRIERALATIASNINKRMEQIARAKAGDTSVFDKREKLESPELAIARNELQKLNEELKNIKQALYPNGTDAEIAQRLNLRMIALSKQYERWNNMVVDYNAADTWEARWAAVAPSQKRPPLESEATRNMAKDRDAAHRKVLEFRKKLELEDTRGEAVKAWARFIGGTSVLARAMLDMSVAGVQGGKFLRSYPIKGVKIGWKATKAFFKQNASDALATEIANHPYFEDFKNSGGHIYAMNGLEGDAPEDFRAVEQGAPLPNGKVITADMIPGVKRSSRSFAGFLNKAALELYSDMVEAAGANGTGATAEQKKLLADFVNISLGYGYGKKNVGKKLSLIPAVLDAIAWAPRKAVAELKYATLYPLLTNWAGTRKHEISGKEIWAVDKAIGRQYLRYTLGSLAFGACIVLLAKLFNGDDDDDRNIWSDILDPRSSDFGRIRIGNTSWSVFAGNEMVWRLFARLYAGQTKTNGVVKDYKYHGVEAALDYLRGKLNPLLGAAVDYKMNKNFVGEKLSEKSAWELANDYVLPLTASALYENFANNPDDPLAAIFNAIPTFFGMTSYTYERDPLARVVKQGDEAVRIARSSGDRATGERIDASLKGVRSEVYGAAKEVLKLEKNLKELKAVKDKSADVKNAIKELEKIIPEKRKAAIELYHRARKSGIKWDNMGWTTL